MFGKNSNFCGWYLKPYFIMYIDFLKIYSKKLL